MTTLTKIGNSYGVRIPKLFIEKAHLFNAQIDFEIVDGGLLLRPYSSNSRKMWEENIQTIMDQNRGVQDDAIDSEWLEDSDLEPLEW